MRDRRGRPERGRRFDPLRWSVVRTRRDDPTFLLVTFTSCSSRTGPADGPTHFTLLTGIPGGDDSCGPSRGVSVPPPTVVPAPGQTSSPNLPRRLPHGKPRDNAIRARASRRHGPAAPAYGGNGASARKAHKLEEVAALESGFRARLPDVLLIDCGDLPDREPCGHGAGAKFRATKRRACGRRPIRRCDGIDDRLET